MKKSNLFIIGLFDRNHILLFGRRLLSATRLRIDNDGNGHHDGVFPMRIETLVQI